MNPNETRSSHPSSAQVETLIEFMERNPGMAKGFLRTQNARERSRRQWEELAVRLNSIGGTIKTYKQWTKYWSDKKSAIKKIAAPPPSQRRTEFSTTTERFLRVEEQQLELQRLNSQILQSFLERSAERDKILAEAVAAVGKGLQALAEAKNRDRV
ncbi:unnamed protein product [Colias eurytheme]|nr:unnamed protein product [Colias eurytheme]